MFTIDTSGLVAEYLFESPPGTGLIRNTASPGTLDGMLVHDATNHPLMTSADVPPGFIGAASLNYNVLRRLSDTGAAPQASFAQYVEVGAFPDLAELTVEVWVKLDYAKADPAFSDPVGVYPDNEIGFGACPQPVCKSNSWYLFLSTLQTDRNLILTIIPDAVTQGLPKAADVVSGSGGVVSEDIVHGGQWTHMAATFQQIAPGRSLMQTYVNGIRSHQEDVTRFDGTTVSIPNETDNLIASMPGSPLRLGQFRDIQPDLDYQYSGFLCGIRIYSRALTQEQIQDDYRHDICDRMTPKGKELSKIEKLEKIEKFEKPEKPEKIEKIEKAEKPEKSEKIEKIEKVEKPEKSEFDFGGFGNQGKFLQEQGPFQGGLQADDVVGQISGRLANIERSVEQLQHFISQEMRPDLSRAALRNEADVKQRKKKTD